MNGSRPRILSGFYRKMGKRTFDLVASLLLLSVLWPLILLVAAATRWKLGQPVLFRQRRPGLGGHPFTLFKFRTMLDTRSSAGDLLPDKERLTPFGEFLRKTSIDELPALWNVIRGDMSLVGPRPLLTEYLPLYNECQARRHEVLPGITGWAQIHGRNDLRWEEKFERDLWYVENYGFRTDLRILARTLWIVVARRGISAQGHASMPKFRGSDP